MPLLCVSSTETEKREQGKWEIIADVANVTK
jgi:phenylpyruvate tautomerase PptA (4-oxalocrotonate tautomerase family)